MCPHNPQPAVGCFSAETTPDQEEFFLALGLIAEQLRHFLTLVIKLQSLHGFCVDDS